MVWLCLGHLFKRLWFRWLNCNSLNRRLMQMHTHCIFRLFLIKSNIWPISKIYLTTNQPYVIRFQKNKKIRKLYSPDPDSGSGIPENWDQFFSQMHSCEYFSCNKLLPKMVPSIGCLYELGPIFRPILRPEIARYCT